MSEIQIETKSANPLAKGITTGVSAGIVTELILGPIGIPVGVLAGVIHILVEWNKRDKQRLEIEKKNLEINKKSFDNQVKIKRTIRLGLNLIAICILGVGLVLSVLIIFAEMLQIKLI